MRRRNTDIYAKARIFGKYLLLVCLLDGCGYTLSHRLKGPFQDLAGDEGKGVFIPVFTNLTEETGVESVFTDALIREIASRRQIRVRSREEGALEIRGAVTQIDYTAVAFSETGARGLQSYRRLPTEFSLTITLRLDLYEPKGGKWVWGNTFSGFRRVAAPPLRTYDHEAPSSVGPHTLSTLELQYTAVARDIMRDVYDDMVELF